MIIEIMIFAASFLPLIFVFIWAVGGREVMSTAVCVLIAALAIGAPFFTLNWVFG